MYHKGLSDAAEKKKELLKKFIEEFNSNRSESDCEEDGERRECTEDEITP
jgi:hypothetical protein